MRERGDSLLEHTENVPHSFQSRSAHESGTFDVGNKTLRERQRDPLLIMTI